MILHSGKRLKMCAPLTVLRRSLCGIRKHTSRSFGTLFNDAHNKCSTKRNISLESAFNERQRENPFENPAPRSCSQCFQRFEFRRKMNLQKRIKYHSRK